MAPVCSCSPLLATTITAVSPAAKVSGPPNKAARVMRGTSVWSRPPALLTASRSPCRVVTKRWSRATITISPAIDPNPVDPTTRSVAGSTTTTLP